MPCSIPKGCALQISGVLSLCTLSSGTVSFQPSSLGLLRLSAPSHQLSKSARLCLGGDSLCYGLETKAVSWKIVCFFLFLPRITVLYYLMISILKTIVLYWEGGFWILLVGFFYCFRYRSKSGPCCSI